MKCFGAGAQPGSGLRRSGRHCDHHCGEAALQDETAPGKHRVQGVSQYGDKDSYSTLALHAHAQC